ncbi:hypothetical protein HMPREF1872_01216 [Amygdalobacter nucleatus]|uniref:Uncharacterized protein n=1 Tax=Amygdalobacter nucleatus TaxID=3029274 RepID=A0A133Y7V5_9FIRM|nr:hypothetical protein HMPREF1872_01216 [Amygdalobacter nucleatus]
MNRQLEREKSRKITKNGEKTRKTCFSNKNSLTFTFLVLCLGSSY